MAHIHTTCLQATRETVCSVCHMAYEATHLTTVKPVAALAQVLIVPPPPPVQPWLCTGIADISLRCFLFLLGGLNMLDTQSILWIQRCLALLYIRACVPAMRPYVGRPAYWRRWMRPWILDARSHIYFPLGAVCGWLLTLYVPYAILYMNAFLYVWRVHGVLVEGLGNP